jgi:triosephosphate isomerase
MAARPLIIGNWKMNGLTSSAGELEKIIGGASRLDGVAVMVCPPATLLASFAAAARGSAVAIGGQDCHPLAAGPYTGDISAEMLKDAGATAVIVGHSERRQFHAETDELVREKALAARRAGLLAIVCVGETRAERDAGHARAVVRAQLADSLPEGADDLLVAYEPVWAIGSGLTPSKTDVADMHGFIRRYLCARYGEHGQALRILYGGSVKRTNASALLSAENVDGALVGGASLHADEFLEIAAAFR